MSFFALNIMVLENCCVVIIYECIIVVYPIAELMLLDECVRSCFRSLIASSYIPVHMQKFFFPLF